jgi:hypothetical protein
MTRELCQADFLFPGLRYQQVCWEQPLVPTSRNAARQQRREVGPPLSGQSAPFDTGESAFYPDYVLNPAFSGRLCCCMHAPPRG